MSEEFDYEGLLRRIAEDSPKDEGVLCERYLRGVYYVLFKDCGDRQLSEDLAQDTMETVLIKARNGEITSAFGLSSFVYGVAQRKLMNHVRGTKRRKTDNDIDQILEREDGSPSLISLVSATDVATVVQDAISALKNDRYSKILQQHYVYQISKAQICQDFQLSPSQMDTILSRARQSLKKEMLRRGYGDRGLRITEVLVVLVASTLVAKTGHEVRCWPDQQVKEMVSFGHFSILNAETYILNEFALNGQTL